MELSSANTFSSLKVSLSKGLALDGCFVDTSILFSATYPLDPFNGDSESIFEALVDFDIALLSNVNVRAEFLENHRRVLIAECLIELLEDRESFFEGVVAEKLKAHRASYRRKMAEEKSAKMEINQIRIFRRLLSSYQTFPKKPQCWRSDRRSGKGNYAAFSLPPTLVGFFRIFALRARSSATLG